jgi:chemotaxis protein MotB
MEFFRIRRSEPDAHETKSLWLIIYTDMISNLMIFFLMLYCLTWLGDEERAIAAASFKEAFAGDKGAVERTVTAFEAQAEESKRVETKIAEEFTQVSLEEQWIRITLPSPVLFASGSALLREETKPALHHLAELVRASAARVVVEGHTDDRPLHGGAFSSNRELSSARAFSVLRHLIETERIDPARLSAIGYGEYHPAAPNLTEAGRAANRRIEILIARNKS